MAIDFEAGSVARGALQRRNVAQGLSGFSFAMPIPDPNRELLWAELRIIWFFNGWKSEWPKNTSSSSLHVEGSVDWYWFLTGNPFHFDEAPIFLTDGGHFEFETSVSPGARGFDVGWISPARSGIFTNEPDKQDERNLSPLQRLLSLRVDDELKIWFAMETRRESPWASHNPWGANRLEYVYAYIRR